MLSKFVLSAVVLLTFTTGRAASAQSSSAATAVPSSAGTAALTAEPDFAPMVHKFGYNLWLVLGMARIGERKHADSNMVETIVESLRRINVLADVHCGPDDPCREFLAHVLADRVKWAYQAVETASVEERALINRRLREVIGYVNHPSFVGVQIERANLASDQSTRSGNADRLITYGALTVVADATILAVAAITDNLNWVVGGSVGAVSAAGVAAAFMTTRRPYAVDRTAADSPNYVGPAFRSCAESLIE